MQADQILKLFIALIAMCNPITVLPIFLALSADRGLPQQKQVAIKASIATAVILIVCVWAGAPLLKLFGIDIPTFEVAGGIIILLMGIAMLNGGMSATQHTDSEQKAALSRPAIAVVPLAIPIMAGPGTISTIIVNTGHFPSIVDRLWIVLVAVVVSAIVGLTLYFGNYISKFIGHNGIKIASRIMGLILTAIAVSMLHEGLIMLFPGWAG